mmetsp:Transcript_12802/g.40865  ORF Transcript_12802/g.40865 Transcript_12802/m.40865 type:complete len:129 (-) Transcript_12802:293-679(-)
MAGNRAPGAHRACRLFTTSRLDASESTPRARLAREPDEASRASARGLPPWPPARGAHRSTNAASSSSSSSSEADDQQPEDIMQAILDTVDELEDDTVVALCLSVLLCFVLYLRAREQRGVQAPHEHAD